MCRLYHFIGKCLWAGKHKDGHRGQTHEVCVVDWQDREGEIRETINCGPVLQ